MSTLYEVSSLITLVMNRPNVFSQVIGILSKGTTIDVINISGSYSYFRCIYISVLYKCCNVDGRFHEMGR